MRANYISYFGKNVGLSRSRLAGQVESAAETSDTVVDVKQASYARTGHVKSKMHAAEESRLFLQYRLDL